MGIRDRRVDRYIADAAPFARPILTHLRDVVHEACPGVEEAVKWGMPFFTYHGNLCFMAAFTRHAGFGFWKGAPALGQALQPKRNAMGQFGPLTRVADLPGRRTLSAAVRRAMRINEGGGAPIRKAKPRPRPAPRAPADLSTALAGAPRAQATWKAFSASHRREYVEWITEAKRPETRRRRVATTVEWLAAGKKRNWKYGG